MLARPDEIADSEGLPEYPPAFSQSFWLIIEEELSWPVQMRMLSSRPTTPWYRHLAKADRREGKPGLRILESFSSKNADQRSYKDAN